MASDMNRHRNLVAGGGAVQAVAQLVAKIDPEWIGESVCQVAPPGFIKSAFEVGEDSPEGSYPSWSSPARVFDYDDAHGCERD